MRTSRSSSPIVRGMSVATRSRRSCATDMLMAANDISTRWASWREPLDQPAGRRTLVTRIPEAVVQPERSRLPELHRVGSEPEPAPKRWARHVGRISLVQLGESFHQLVAPRDHGALLRRPRTDLRLPRPRAEVRVGLLFLGTSDCPDDAYLPIELLPKKRERSVSVLGEMVALAALGVGVEGDPSFDD